MMAFALALIFLLNYKLKLCVGTANVCFQFSCASQVPGWFVLKA